VQIEDQLQVECDAAEYKLAMAQNEADEEYDGECSVICLQGVVDAKGNNYQTIKLRGEIHGVPIVMLLDSGASHNFVSRRLVEAMEWPQSDTRSMNIRMGDGHRSRTRGVCRNLSLKIEGCEFSIDAYLFELEDLDMILGMLWLTTQGEMKIDWKNQIIQINTEEGQREFRGMDRDKKELEAFFTILENSNVLIDGIRFPAEVSIAELQGSVDENLS
jgi:hypothetical protein